jgi:hypothetical protein
MSGFAADYIQVNERIIAFREKYPDGCLQTDIIELTESRVTMRAYAYRTPDDPRPGIGHSTLGIPGTTPYTRGSELENCETSAWGRALAALGFEVKRAIASAEEVANKAEPAKPPRAAAPARPAPPRLEPRPAAADAPEEPDGLFNVIADDGMVASAMALAAEQPKWKEGDKHNPAHKGLIRNARGLFCPTQLSDQSWCKWSERSA